MSKKISRFIAPVTAGVLIFVLCMFANDGFFGDNKSENILYAFCNCFSVPGVVLSGIAVISWIGTFGTFDMLGYGSRSFFGAFIKPLSKDLPRTFYDYRQQKNENGRKWLRETLYTGLVFLGTSLLLMVIGLII